MYLTTSFSRVVVIYVIYCKRYSIYSGFGRKIYGFNFVEFIIFSFKRLKSFDEG